MPTCPLRDGRISQTKPNEFICETSTNDTNDTDVTRWLFEARQGDQDSFSMLFGYYFRQLTMYLRGQLVPLDRAAGLEEDLANETMAGFWQDLTNGRFGHITNRDELWFALMRVAKSCAVDRKKYLSRKKRLVNEVVGSASLFEVRRESKPADDELEVMDNWDSFTNTLPNDQFRQIVEWKLLGLDAPTIAERMGILPRSVHRKIQIVREMWVEFVSVKNNL